MLPVEQSNHHQPVLIKEVCNYLFESLKNRIDLIKTPKTKLNFFDGTLGGGGHSLAMLEAGAHVSANDRDPAALAAARVRLASFESAGRFRAVRGNYADVDRLPELAAHTFDGILLDLGVSSHQIDDEARGFSFREGAPLDMRMGGTGPAAAGEALTAADLLNNADEADLKRILREYGDEPKAGRLAHEIVRRRANRPFASADDFVGAIRGVLGSRSGPPEFARLFQALRIAVNDELDGLERALPALRDRLAPGGVLAVIAYHSGEDRLVKHAFREWSLSCVCPPRQLVCNCRGRPLGTLMNRKPVLATPAEVARNPRARSAHLRAWRRLPVAER